MKRWTSTVLVAALMSTSAAFADPAAAPATSQEPLSKAVGPYAAFQNDITDLSKGGISSAAELDAALERAANQNLDALTRGWIAYGAMTAAQSREFVAAVRETAGFYGKDSFMRGLTLDPSYAPSLNGGDGAMQMAMEAAQADGARVYQVGERYKEMAYTLQRQRWANQVAPQQAARVNKLRQLAASAAGRADEAVAPRFAIAAGTSAADQPLGARAFWDTLRSATGPVAETAALQPGPSPVVRPNQERASAFHRMTSLAALYALDATTDANAQADRLMMDTPSRNCIEMAQAQFYQCMSAARFRYENAFCLGEHALKDMGSCIKDATVVDAGAAQAPPTLVPPLLTAAK